MLIFVTFRFLLPFFPVLFESYSFRFLPFDELKGDVYDIVATRRWYMKLRGQKRKRRRKWKSKEEGTRWWQQVMPAGLQYAGGGRGATGEQV